VAFALAFLGPLLQTAVPALSEGDPLWMGSSAPLWSLPGHFLAISGAMLAWAGQIGMGASWRVGVAEDATGELVAEGLFRVSRNPVFTGQLLLLTGVALSVPSVLTWVAVLLLETRFGEAYRAYRARVPRWISPVPAVDGDRSPAQGRSP